MVRSVREWALCAREAFARPYLLLRWLPNAGLYQGPEGHRALRLHGRRRNRRASLEAVSVGRGRLTVPAGAPLPTRLGTMLAYASGPQLSATERSCGQHLSTRGHR